MWPRSISPRSCARTKIWSDHIGRSARTFSRTWAGVRPVLASRPENTALTVAAKLTRVLLKLLSSAIMSPRRLPVSGTSTGFVLP
jgi:hypothetical protein